MAERTNWNPTKTKSCKKGQIKRQSQSRSKLRNIQTDERWPFHPT